MNKLIILALFALGLTLASAKNLKVSNIFIPSFFWFFFNESFPKRMTALIAKDSSKVWMESVLTLDQQMKLLLAFPPSWVLAAIAGIAFVKIHPIVTLSKLRINQGLIYSKMFIS